MNISIVIPTYNRSNTVGHTIQSIIDGSYSEFEIIIVDQSPNDETFKVVEQFGNECIRYIKTPIPGASAARNIGIAESNGEIIALTDDDVEAYPDWLTLIASEFASDPEVQFIIGSLIAPEYDQTKGFVPEFEAHPDITPYQLVQQAANANFSMRRTLFDRIGGYDELCGPGSVLQSSDDTDILLRIVRSGVKWKAIPSIAVVHTHGFRPTAEATALIDGYEFGNGAVFGRAARRGDIIAWGWFVAHEIKQLLTTGIALLRRQPHNGRHMTRIRGFMHGFALPPKQGYVTGSELRCRKGQAYSDNIL
jgi:glycosyltransferase involved in cell wall biosynthesis